MKSSETDPFIVLRILPLDKDKTGMHLGFIGTGHITAALVEGLCTISEPPENILVSPRNAANASRLAAKFSRVKVAQNNQAVIDGSEIIFLALHPQIAPAILPQLLFRQDQRIVSLIAATPIALIRKLTGTVQHVFRAVPLPSVARHVGPIVLYPDNARIGDIFNKIGKLFVVASEKHLSLLAAVTALISPFFALMEETAGWAAAAGIEKQTANDYTASMFHALATRALDMQTSCFAELAQEAATPGGLNEQALGVIRQNGGFKAFRAALDSVAVRLGEGPPHRRRK
jgi:pyrroline-5-carboxylate reductase